MSKSKKLSKSENFFKNNIIKKLSFLILKIKITFHYLWLAFTKILVF